VAPTTMGKMHHLKGYDLQGHARLEGN